MPCSPWCHACGSNWWREEHHIKGNFHVLFFSVVKFLFLKVCSCFKTLGGALGALHKRGLKESQFFPVHYFFMNPKSITIGELYGEVNSLTMEWKDGLLGISVRAAVQVNRKYLQYFLEV